MLKIPDKIGGAVDRVDDKAKAHGYFYLTAALFAEKSAAGERGSQLFVQKILNLFIIGGDQVVFVLALHFNVQIVFCTAIDVGGGTYSRCHRL